MKTLFVSNLFPDAAEPGRGLYNARLVKHLGALCEVRVASPRPTRNLLRYFLPASSPTITPRPEDIQFSPLFPPAPYIPKIGSRWNPKLMAGPLGDALKALRRSYAFECVLVSWVYPDACAVAAVAEALNFPFVAIAQGSDVHQYLQIPARREIIISSLHRAQAVITRSCDLKRLLQSAGIPEHKLHVIYNGVEPDIFQPGDRPAARSALGLTADETLLLFVGNFLPVKNPLLLLDAFQKLQQQDSHRSFRLVLLGDGPLRAEIEHRINASDLRERVTLPGRKTPADVARYMQAADLLCIPSQNEGVPNVALEAFACGLRVVATSVGGLPEILTDPAHGTLTPPGDAGAFAAAITGTLARPLQPDVISLHAQQFSWPKTAAACLKLLDRHSGAGGIA